MKKGLFFIVLFVNFIFINAQTQEQTVDNLSKLAKVWGFLKYYHPSIASGKYDWDHELTKIIPEVSGAKSKDEFSSLILNWVESFGDIKECRKCNRSSQKEYFEKNFNLNWLQDSTKFTDNLIEKLQFISLNRHIGRKFYVEKEKAGNVRPKNEKTLGKEIWRQPHQKWIPVFRYWNLIEYFAPNKYLTDESWDKVLLSIIPKFLESNTELEYHLAFKELVANLDDSHANFFSDSIIDFWGDKHIPMSFLIIDNTFILSKPYNDSLAKINDIKVGDIVVEANNKPVDKILENRWKYISGSNKARKLYNSWNAVLSGNSDSVRLKILRNGKVFDKSVCRYSKKELSNASEHLKKWMLINDSIGLVNTWLITPGEVKNMFETLKETKAIIFDMRKRPRVPNHYLITKYIKSKETPFHKKLVPDLQYPGLFYWSKGDESGSKKESVYNGKVILLVNEKAQSHTEFAIMNLQSGDKVTTIGSQTSGADGRISFIELFGGNKTGFTGNAIFYPDGSETQRKGVKIDIEVKVTINGIIEGKDEILEKAIEFAAQ